VNTIYPYIQLAVQTEQDDHLPLMDINTYRRPDVSLDNTLYRKPTHTKLYLNAKLHHHPTNKNSVFATVADSHQLPRRVGIFRRSTFKRNKYVDRHIIRVFDPSKKKYISFVGLPFNRSRVLTKHNTKILTFRLRREPSLFGLSWMTLA